MKKNEEDCSCTDECLGYLTMNCKEIETLEEAAEKYQMENGGAYSMGLDDAFYNGAKWQQEQILDFLYSEITERRDYSASKMCEKVVEFIEQFKKK
jgi:hypothetical protein